MRETTHRVMFVGGPFHGRIATFNQPPPEHAKINRGQYDMIGRTKTGLFLLRWTGTKQP